MSKRMSRLSGLVELIGRLASRRTIAVMLVGAIVVMPSAWVIWIRASEPADGTLILPASAGWTSEGLRLARVAGPSPLRQGDLVVAVDGVALSEWVDRPHPRIRAGDRLRYLVRRDGTLTEVNVEVRGYPFWDVLAGSATVLPFIVVYWTVAGVVFVRRPGPATGALLAMAGLAVMGRTTWPFGVQVLDLVGGVGVRAYLVGDLANLLVWAVLLHFALVLPAGRPLLHTRPRLVTAGGYLLPWLLYGAWAAHALVTIHDPLERLGRLIAISTPAAAVYPALTVVVLTAGWQRVADHTERARLRWVVSGLAISAVLYLALGQLPNLVAGGPLIPWEWQPLAVLVTPLAISWAIVRYRLFDIETVLRRSVVYAVLTLAVFAAYLLMFRVLVGQLHQREQWVALFSSALLVMIFTGVRDRLRELVSRTLFGLRDNPAGVAAALRQVDPTGAPSVVVGRVVGALATTLRLSYAAVELAGPDGEFQPVAMAGHGPAGAVEVPVTRGEAVVGRLLMRPGPHREPFDSGDRRLLSEVGHLISSFVTSALLAEELLRARRQLVIARADERRRLRRDLHDRIGPRLAGIAMVLEAAKSQVRPDPDGVTRLLAVQAAGTREVAEEVNRAVDGLRPRVLDQRGLHRALQTRASNVIGQAQVGGMTVRVDVDGELDELPAAVEVAAFDIVMEAVHNVAKHSGAATCTVLLARCQEPNELRVEIRDDGGGLPAGYTPGVGLRSMRVRAEELGGTCSVSVVRPTGTLVSARLPIDGP